MLDTAAFILYPIEACLGVPAIVVIGKAFHWRRSTIALCASGLLLAVVLELFFYFAFLLPLALHQCFHLVGGRRCFQWHFSTPSDNWKLLQSQARLPRHEYRT